MKEVYAIVTKNGIDPTDLTREQYNLYIDNKMLCQRERKTYDKYGRVRRIHSKGTGDFSGLATIHEFTFPGDKTGGAK